MFLLYGKTFYFRVPLVLENSGLPERFLEQPICAFEVVHKIWKVGKLVPFKQEAAVIFFLVI